MNTAKSKVVVLGGGFAGLETLFYLRSKVGDRADLTLVTDQDHFLFKPNTIYIPFGQEPDRFKVDLGKPTRRKDIELKVEEAREIDLDNKTVNGTIPYDYLVVATGAAMRAEEVPGLEEHALTLWTTDQMLDLRRRYQAIVEAARSGRRTRLLFLVPPNNKCSGPLYELVMMTDTWLRREKVRDWVEMTWATYEESYIQAFGPRLNTVVEDEFLERGVQGYRGYVVTGVEPGKVVFQNGEVLPYDTLVSFPPYVARRAFPGLPTDERGFVRVEPQTRRVRGQENVFAVGDAADFPIKQAFLALLQGDAAGEQLAAAVAGREPDPRVAFEPMSMCVMEELNRATFAQVPLKYTDDPLKPVAVDTDDPDHYKVGISPLWRGGKKLLGLYLPWRFSSGEPFHSGFAWDVMDMGLKVMSKVLAT